MKDARQTECYEVCLLPEQKERMERAARFEGLSLVDFIVKYADEAAIRTIEWHTSWALEERDRGSFVKTLFSPPQPIANDETAIDGNLEPPGKW